MKLLLDTHVLIWATANTDRLSNKTKDMIDDGGNDIYFSAASIWEVAIKAGQGRVAFDIDPQLLRTALIANGYRELPVTAGHAAAVRNLPPIHKDPFDRMLIAQARVEGMVLLSVDELMLSYGAPVRMA